MHILQHKVIESIRNSTPLVCYLFCETMFSLIYCTYLVQVSQHALSISTLSIS